MEKTLKEIFCSQAIFIIMMQGRLGNLMFDYALLLSLRTKYPKHKGYLYRDKNAPGKTGSVSELRNIFNIPSSDFASEELMTYIKSLPMSYIHYVWEKDFACRPSIYLEDSLITICIGYWQTETSFDNVKPEIRKAFSFNCDILNGQTRVLAERLSSEEAIALHVRRGDYFTPNNIKMFGGNCTIDYYREALAIIYNRVGNKLPVYCFSDDPDWVKSELHLENSIVVDWNNGDESWQDMYLMSLCHHNIIANSTFSWWGAWLNMNKDKIVVAPYRCFNTVLTPEIHPDEWFTIYPKGYVKNDFVWKLEKNKISLERNGLFYGKMGVAVFLFHYASVYQDEFYENIAMNLILTVFSRINTQTSIDYADGLSGMGCAIEYLYQNEFVEGDINEILSDLDLLFDDILNDSRKKKDSYANLLGLIRYYRFRLSGKYLDSENERTKKNKLNLSYLLNLLESEVCIPLCDKEDIISELYEMSILELYSKQVKKLLSHYLFFSECGENDVIQRAAKVSEERNATIKMGETPGLMGMAGKELLRLSPDSKINWIKLL
ncbi:MAG: alpha-1,2-fucosyltransferase [Parabacteroides gordonii]|uniref:alpha-1,2-fucosyltransferase n=1 Tax=Bacteroidales TaxID=171549 RepID=UPI003A850E12